MPNKGVLAGSIFIFVSFESRASSCRLVRKLDRNQGCKSFPALSLCEPLKKSCYPFPMVSVDPVSITMNFRKSRKEAGKADSLSPLRSMVSFCFYSIAQNLVKWEDNGTEST